MKGCRDSLIKQERYLLFAKIATLPIEHRCRGADGLASEKRLPGLRQEREAPALLRPHSHQPLAQPGFGLVRTSPSAPLPGSARCEGGRRFHSQSAPEGKCQSKVSPPFVTPDENNWGYLCPNGSTPSSGRTWKNPDFIGEVQTWPSAGRSVQETQTLCKRDALTAAPSARPA